eukprot:COSAG05_NODE_249_length_12903_cov_128.635505_4_plen_357_part_00
MHARVAPCSVRSVCKRRWTPSPVDLIEMEPYDPCATNSMSLSVPKGSKGPVALITHASMNPVHLGHIEMMRCAKAALEAQGYRVVRGEIAITDAHWIRKKGVAPIGNAERLRLIELASAAEPWLFGRDGSKYISSKRYITGELPRLRGVTGEPELRCADCQGSDVILRFNSRSDIAVVVCRCGDEAELRAWEAENAANGGPPVIVLPPAAGVLGAASSTAARAACDAGDEEHLVSICGPVVAAELFRTVPGGRRTRAPQPAADEGFGKKNKKKKNKKTGKKGHDLPELDEPAPAPAPAPAGNAGDGAGMSKTELKRLKREQKKAAKAGQKGGEPPAAARSSFHDGGDGTYDAEESG